MANSYFRFKEFTVEQDKCAMKVCTDACLFGAWIAEKKYTGRILDIGAGTGLLSLMLAQQSAAYIDAVEIDGQAYEQAKENLENSPWRERLSVFNVPIQDYSAGKYDLIISNPPFFENDLKSADTKRNLALHSGALTLGELLLSVKKMLNDTGKFAVLLPFHRSTELETLALQNDLFPKEKVLVKQTPKHPYFRVMYLYSSLVSASEPHLTEITIKDDTNNYTESFKYFLKNYYLFI